MLIFNSVYAYNVNPELIPWYLTEPAQFAFNLLLWGGFVCILGYCAIEECFAKALLKRVL